MLSQTNRILLPLLLSFLFPACHKPDPQIERRVLVDVVGDCVALRERLSECPSEAADLILDRRSKKDPHLAQRLAEPAERAVAQKEVGVELLREAELAPQERRRQCRQVAADAPAPNPEDVARLHQCLPLPCRERLFCLRPLMLPGK
jgi:hypothetical protein